MKKVLPILAITLAIPALASAQIFMDVNGTTAGFGSLGNNTWNTSNTNWTTDPGGTSATSAWDNTSGTTTFDTTGGGGIVTVGSNFTVSGLSLVGSANLTLSSGSASRTITTSSVNVASGRILTITATGSGNTLTMNGTFTKTGGGILNYDVNSSIGATSAVTLSAGQINFRGAGAGTTFDLASGTTLRNALTAATAINIGTLTGSGGTIDATGGSNAFPLTITQASNGVFSGVIANRASGGGVTSLTKSGAARLTLDGNNTYTGNTTISNGILQIGNGGTTGSLATAGIINNSQLVFNRSNDYTFSNVISGNGSVTQNGTGNLTLSASNTYSGATNVNAGKLVVTGSLAGGAVTVGASGSLGGNGSIGGATTINGTLSPGTSPGTLTINNTLTLASTAILDWEINISDNTVGGGINDLVTGVTNLTLDGTINFTLIGGPQITAPNTWRLFNYSGTLTNNILDIGTLSLASGLSAYIDTSTPNQVNLVVVPEPTSWALLAGSLMLTFLVRRRRKI